MTCIHNCLSKNEIKKVINITNLDNSFFDSLIFVKRNLLKRKEDGVIESYNIDNCDNKLSKVIYKDENFHYKIYFSPNNFYLNDVLYLYKNNIIQKYTSDIIFIKNQENKIIGYKHKTIKTNMKTVNQKELINFYTDFTEVMRNNNLCCFDISPKNLGYVSNNDINIVKLIDIDLFISANTIFPEYKQVNMSNINVKWHIKYGIKKYNDIMKSLKLYDFELYKYYQK